MGIKRSSLLAGSINNMVINPRLFRKPSQLLESAPDRNTTATLARITWHVHTRYAPINQSHAGEVKAAEKIY